MPGASGLATQLQGAPEWLQQYTQELIQKSRQLGSERYQPYGQVTPERNQAIRDEIGKLVNKSQEKGILDVVSFSITGKSKPINISPFDLKNIIEDEGFARRVYENTTGYHNVSRGEVEDLIKRAKKKLESEASSSPQFLEILNDPQKPINKEFEKYAAQKGIFVSQIEQINAQQEGFKREISELDGQKSSIASQFHKLESREQEINREFEKYAAQKQLIINQITPENESMRGEFVSQINTIESFEQPLHAELREIQSQKDQFSNKIKEIQVLEGQFKEKIQAVEHDKIPITRKINEIESFEKPLHEELRKLSDKRSSISERSSIEREIRNLQRERSTIAPMNDIHERAISMLERTFDDDTMKLAADELSEARKHSELRAVEPILKHSIEGPSDEYMHRYVNDYTKDIRKALEDESEEQYIKDIAPKINMSFAQMGAFHSGARAKALRDSLLQHRTKLHRELAHLTSHARDKAMEHHELQKRREQSAAGLLESATKAEKDSARQQSELLRNQAITKHGLAQLNVNALSQIARAKQEQEQHEIDAEKQELARQTMHPYEQLARESALMSGLPLPASQSLAATMQSAPPPPNLFTIAAGTLGSLAAGLPQQQQQQQQQQRAYKKGGSVRRNYDSGGHVGIDHIGNEMRNIIEQQKQADKSHLEEASHYNPVQSWLRHVGGEMLSNPHEDPLLSLGRGTAASLNHRDVVRERASNLYDKIQATRLNQYQVLAAFENMKEHNALQRENLLERKKYHEEKNNLRKNVLKGAQIESLNNLKMDKPLTSSERKIEVDAKKDLLRAIRMKKEVNHLGELIEKTSTGPIIGGIKGILPKTKIDNQIEVGTNKLILDMHQGMKNIPRSEEFLKRIESTKPNRSNYHEANIEAINLMRQGANDVEEHSISTLLSMGWTPKKIERQFKVKVPRHFIEDYSTEISQEGLEEKVDTVKMIDPNGNPLEVPESDVEEALRAGARRV